MGTNAGFSHYSSDYPTPVPYYYPVPSYGGSGSSYGSGNYGTLPVYSPIGSYGASPNYGGYNNGNYGYKGAYGGSQYAAGEDGTYSAEPSYQASGGTPAYRPRAVKAKQENIPLAVLGVPTEDGKVKWPLALRLLPPEQREETLNKLEAELKVIAAQVVSGNASPAVVKLAKQNVAKLNEQLRARRINMAEGTFHEADTFLLKLDDALQSIAQDKQSDQAKNAE